MTWTKSVDIIAKKASKSASYLLAKSRTAGNFSYTVFTNIYKSLVMNIIEYSSHIWGLQEYRCLELVQNNLMTSFLGLRKSAPIAGLCREMNWRLLHWQTKYISERTVVLSK